MSSIYDLKPRFQATLRPVVRTLAGMGVTANQVTIAALMLSAAAGACILLAPTERWPLLLLPAALFLRMALNAVDGMLAHEHDMKTPLGAVLNELGDVISDSVLYLPLAVVPGFPASWVVAAVLLSAVGEMAGVIGAQIGASRRYDGPMGKSDRAFVLGLIALLLGVGVDPGPWLGYALIGITALLVITVLNRAWRAVREVQ